MDTRRFKQAVRAILNWSAATALAALARQQPFFVWFPLSLSALILMVVYWVWLLNVRNYYRATPG